MQGIMVRINEEFSQRSMIGSGDNDVDPRRDLLMSTSDVSQVAESGSCTSDLSQVAELGSCFIIKIIVAKQGSVKEAHVVKQRHNWQVDTS